MHISLGHNVAFFPLACALVLLCPAITSHIQLHAAVQLQPIATHPAHSAFCSPVIISCTSAPGVTYVPSKLACALALLCPRRAEN